MTKTSRKLNVASKIYKGSKVPIEALKKAMLKKEAIASCELDKDCTQTGDMTIEPVLSNGFAVYYCDKCNRYTDVRYLFDKKKGERPKSYCYKCSNESLIPCNVQFDKNTIEPKEEQPISMTSKQFKEVCKEVDKAKQQGISQRTQDILDILEKWLNTYCPHNENNYTMACVECFNDLKKQIKALDSPQTKSNSSFGELHSDGLSKESHTLNAPFKSKRNKTGDTILRNDVIGVFKNRQKFHIKKDVRDKIINYFLNECPKTKPYSSNARENTAITPELRMKGSSSDNIQSKKEKII